MKIGITTFGGDGGKSGISQYIIRLLRAFDAMHDGTEFEVMVYEDEQSIFVPASSSMKPLCFGGGLRNPILNVAWHQAALPGWCRKRGFDVLFLPAGNRRLPLKAPCPTVGTVHDFSSIHVKEKYDPARMFYIKKVLPFLVRKLTLVLTVSESSKRDIVEFARVPEDRVLVTPLGVDRTAYYPRDRDLAQAGMANKYGTRPPYILYISRIEHPGKNHVRLIRAFSRLKARTRLPHQLVLAGSDWTRSEEVHREADQSPFARDILFTGFASGNDLPLLYAGADLFLFPSLYEGFGMPVLEAMACRAPVACSNLSSLPEVAGDAALLFDPYDEEDMASVMERILTDARLRETLAEKGWKRAQGYTWEATARQTLQALYRAAEAGR
jgi:glycosyltransferase involved in cell wall biosynthesis